MKRKQNDDDDCPKPKGPGAAFLLAQVGAHAASRFAARLAEVGLVPAHAGIFRILSATPAISQQALAAALGTVPSRLVGLVDELEARGLVERRAHESDRRTYALHLTEKGKATMETIRRVAREHREDLLVALSQEEQATLSSLLQRVSEQQRLLKGVHPGFAKMTQESKMPRPEVSKETAKRSGARGSPIAASGGAPDG